MLAVAFRPEMIPVMVIIVLLAIHALKTYRKAGTRVQAVYARSGDQSGWVYFATGAEGPVKIGCTERQPCHDRLPELRTMSPIPLRIIYKVAVPDRYAAEAKMHDDLAAYRQHGEWFDRDATLYYIDHLKGLA